MGRVNAWLTLSVLLLLLTFSSGRSPLNEEFDHFLFPESESNNPIVPHNILLPTEDDHHSQSNDVHFESNAIPFPFTLVTIRPYPLSPGHRLRHRCHHDHHLMPFNHPLADHTTFFPLPQIPSKWTRSHTIEPTIDNTDPIANLEPHHQDKGLMKKIRKFLDHF